MFKSVVVLLAWMLSGAAGAQAMRAEAVAERGGKIVAVGTKASVMKLEGSGTKVIDLEGRTMLPGFVAVVFKIVGTDSITRPEPVLAWPGSPG